MRKNDLDLEDDLRPEYDLRSLKVRKLGPERKSFCGSKVPTKIEDEIDILIKILEQPFISQRTGFQRQIIHVKETTNWKAHQRFFLLGYILSFISFAATFCLAFVLYSHPK